MLDLSYIQSLRLYLDSHPCIDFDARTQILYPLLDQLYSDNDRLTIRLSNGLILEYLYKSNIAKEILLRDVEVPNHVWEPMTTRSVELALKYKSGSVLIGGAYFGDHALVAALELNKSSGSHKVLCVEPNEKQRNMLALNAKANGLSDRIQLINAVLWDECGLKFNLASSDSHACVFPDPNATLESQTVDQVIQNYKTSNLSLLLLDIEGSEERALLGADVVLSTSQEDAPIVIVEIHKNYVDWSHGLNNTSIVKMLSKYGYSVFALRDCQSNWNLKQDNPEIIPLDRIYLEGPPHGFNLIASKTQDFFKTQGFQVVENVSPKYLRHRSPSLHLPINLNPDLM